LILGTPFSACCSKRLNEFEEVPFVSPGRETLLPLFQYREILCHCALTAIYLGALTIQASFLRRATVSRTCLFIFGAFGFFPSPLKSESCYLFSGFYFYRRTNILPVRLNRRPFFDVNFIPFDDRPFSHPLSVPPRHPLFDLNTLHPFPFFRLFWSFWSISPC